MAFEASRPIDRQTDRQTDKSVVHLSGRGGQIGASFVHLNRRTESEREREREREAREVRLIHRHTRAAQTGVVLLLTDSLTHRDGWMDGLYACRVDFELSCLSVSSASDRTHRTMPSGPKAGEGEGCLCV